MLDKRSFGGNLVLKIDVSKAFDTFKGIRGQSSSKFWLPSNILQLD